MTRSFRIKQKPRPLVRGSITFHATVLFLAVILAILYYASPLHESSSDISVIVWPFPSRTLATAFFAVYVVAVMIVFSVRMEDIRTKRKAPVDPRSNVYSMCLVTVTHVGCVCLPLVDELWSYAIKSRALVQGDHPFNPSRNHEDHFSWIHYLLWCFFAFSGCSALYLSSIAIIVPFQYIVLATSSYSNTTAPLMDPLPVDTKLREEDTASAPSGYTHRPPGQKSCASSRQIIDAKNLDNSPLSSCEDNVIGPLHHDFNGRNCQSLNNEVCCRADLLRNFKREHEEQYGVSLVNELSAMAREISRLRHDIKSISESVKSRRQETSEP